MSEAFRITIEIALDMKGAIPEWWDWPTLLDLKRDAFRMIGCRKIDDWREPPDDRQLMFDLSGAEQPENNR